MWFSLVTYLSRSQKDGDRNVISMTPSLPEPEFQVVPWPLSFQGFLEPQGPSREEGYSSSNLVFPALGLG